MKKLLIIFLATIHYNLIFAQINNNKTTKRELIEQAKIELITKRINLTEAQAEKFWPVFNEYTESRLQIQRSIQKTRRENFTMTASDEDLLKSIDKIFELRQKEVDLEKSTKEKLLKVISPRQLAELYQTEQEFRRRILEILRE